MPIRNLAIALLDDDNGISESAWNLLAVLLKKEGAHNEDILNMVEATDGRFYLPESAVFALKGRV